MSDATHPPREARGSDRGRLVAGGHQDASLTNNLPLELSSFVGREKKLAEVKRLLTLTGASGCGKTRLALAIARDLLEGFEDGVWMVELAPLADPSLVPQAVASTLGIREQPGRSPTETLSDYLGPVAPEQYPAGLSAREAEVLRLVATGLTNAEVAEELFLSSRTVDWHLGSIYRKIGSHSRTEATRFALEHDLLCNEWDVRSNDEVPTDLHVEMGAGESDLDLDSLALEGLDLKIGAGQTMVDLTGDHQQNLAASIQGGVGEATVMLLSEIGVRVRAEGGIGKINAEGLDKEGDSYVNDAYVNSEVTVNVEVQGGVGEINLEVV
jgi:DNA-binding CsgD family transcriptional regulator